MYLPVLSCFNVTTLIQKKLPCWLSKSSSVWLSIIQSLFPGTTVSLCECCYQCCPLCDSLNCGNCDHHGGEWTNKPQSPKWQHCFLIIHSLKKNKTKKKLINSSCPFGTKNGFGVEKHSLLSSPGNEERCQEVSRHFAHERLCNSTIKHDCKFTGRKTLCQCYCHHFTT